MRSLPHPPGAHAVTPVPPHSWQKFVLGSVAAVALCESAVDPSPAEARKATMCLLPTSCAVPGSC